MMISAERKRKPLPFINPLRLAISVGNLSKVKQLIEDGKNPLDRDINNETSLHIAALLGQLHILKYLIEDIGCNPATEGWQGSTTLHIAAQAKHLVIVQYLVERCQLDPATALDSINRSPLVYACHGGGLDVVRYLIRYMHDNMHMNLEDIILF